MSFAVAAGAAVALIGGIVSSSKAKRSREAAERKAANLERRVKGVKRQEITNPYEGVKDLSSMINNPYADLQVATKAAELQGEESDIALATSLDTLRATGSAAGGATALAQAALRSKQGISANIEQQEAQNARMRAQGQAQMNQQLMSEAQRMQQAGVAGSQWMFQQREARDVAELNRLQALMSNEQQAANAYGTAGIAAIGSATGAAAGALAQGDWSKP